MSHSTEESYVGWIRRFILFHGKRHPAEMGAPEVTRFLTALAVRGKVAGSTQNQALSALLFHLESVRAQHQRDLSRGAGWVELPTALGRKYPPSRHISSRMGTTSAQFKTSSGIATSKPRWSTRTC
jgi:hypothetical protein